MLKHIDFSQYGGGVLHFESNGAEPELVARTINIENLNTRGALIIDLGECYKHILPTRYKKSHNDRVWQAVSTPTQLYLDYQDHTVSHEKVYLENLGRAPSENHNSWVFGYKVHQDDQGVLHIDGSGCLNSYQRYAIYRPGCFEARNQEHPLTIASLPQ